MKSRKIFRFAVLLVTFFLTGCATQRYHNPQVPGPAPAPAQTLGSGQPLFQWPLLGRVALPFGSKEDGVTLKGMVLEGSEGQAVMAAADGKVAFVDEGLRGYGKTVILEHSGGFSTVYARNSEILVLLGQWVRRGQSIARVGREGKGGVPRAYFEVRKMAKPEDPRNYIR